MDDSCYVLKKNYAIHNIFFLKGQYNKCENSHFFFFIPNEPVPDVLSNIIDQNYPIHQIHLLHPNDPK